MRVLVVDGSTTVRNVVRRTLETAGYRVAVADDGRSALEAAQQFVPDLILTEAALPGLDGEAFCRALRAISNLRDTPVVLMSAKADRIAESFMESTGAIDAITKPFGPESLLAVTAHALDREALHAVDPFGDPKRLDAAQRQHQADRFAETMGEALSHLYPNIESALRAQPVALRLSLIQAVSSLIPGGDAALRGRVPELALGDVLQLLQTSDGVLYVDDERGRQIEICLGGGRVDLVMARGTSPEFLLGRYLLTENLLDPADLEAHLARASKGRGRLGEQLVRLGYISREDLRAALARQSSELVYEALRWSKARFAFVRFAQRPEANQAHLQLPVTSMLMEGLRRVDEWRLIEEQVRSFDLKPTIDPRAMRDVDRDSMRADERTVLDAIDGKRTIREIVEHTKLGSFDVCKVLYQFMSARVVR